MSRTFLAAALLVLLPLPAALAAQEPAAAAPVRTLRASPLEGTLRIDGRLDEAAWAGAEAAGGFTQSWPTPGAPASKPTEARVLYDDAAIYVGVRAFDASADSVAAQLARRDATGIFSDWLHVVIDSYHDRRTAFRFSVNPLGVQKDVLHSNDTDEDLDWDAVWEVATTVDSLGWTAEYRIPLSQLRYARGEPGAERTWGLQLQREIARLDERDSWSPWTRDSPGYVSRAGDLTGLKGIRPVRRLEVVPYTSARLTRAPGAPGDPFHDGSEAAASAGADVKVGITSALTLTAAINPDFGQVEVDPAVVNLSAFETFFPEKRPFFLEGLEVFRFGGLSGYNRFGWVSEYFYTRRLGRQPQGPVHGAAYADVPGQTTILGAARLTGKTASGWSIGVMDAVTSEERARFEGADGVRREAVVEPRSNYLVGRVRKEMREGRTVVGAILSATHRSLDDATLDSLLRREALLGGVDFEHTWANRGWALTGYLAGTRIEGSPSALRLAQRSSARYFQRPDADHIELDSTRTSLAGRTSALSLAKTSGAWIGSVTAQEATPGVEVNDLGFQSQADRRGLSTFLQYRRNTPGSWYRDWSAHGYTNHGWNTDWASTFHGYTMGAGVTLTNLWGVSGSVTHSPEYGDDRLTRGGPLARLPAQWSGNVGLNTDRRRRVSGGLGASLREDRSGGWGRSLSLSIDARPSSSVRLVLEPSLSRSLGTRQFVQSTPDPLAEATFGRRYVFADAEQTTVSLDTRLDWTFTPRLSLQLFLQPFVSSADFSRYKEFTRPGGLEFDVYGEDRGTIAPREDGSFLVDPDGPGGAEAFAVGTIPAFNRDFTVRSLRGNAVLRWEYRPGSALFLVWQQQRSGFLDPQGQFDLDRDFDLFTDPAANVFLVKMTYWFGR